MLKKTMSIGVLSVIIACFCLLSGCNSGLTNEFGAKIITSEDLDDATINQNRLSDVQMKNATLSFTIKLGKYKYMSGAAPKQSYQYYRIIEMDATAFDAVRFSTEKTL